MLHLKRGATTDLVCEKREAMSFLGLKTSSYLEIGGTLSCFRKFFMRRPTHTNITTHSKREVTPRGQLLLLANFFMTSSSQHGLNPVPIQF